MLLKSEKKSGDNRAFSEIIKLKLEKNSIHCYRILALFTNIVDLFSLKIAWLSEICFLLSKIFSRIIINHAKIPWN